MKNLTLWGACALFLCIQFSPAQGHGRSTTLPTPWQFANIEDVVLGAATLSNTFTTIQSACVETLKSVQDFHAFYRSSSEEASRTHKVVLKFLAEQGFSASTRPHANSDAIPIACVKTKDQAVHYSYRSKKLPILGRHFISGTPS